MSYRKGQETLEEYDDGSNQPNKFPRLCPRTSEHLFLVDQRTTPSNDNERRRRKSRFYHSVISFIERFHRIDQLIEDLILNVNSIHQISIASQLLTLMKDKQDLIVVIRVMRGISVVDHVEFSSNGGCE